MRSGLDLAVIAPPRKRGQMRRRRSAQFPLKGGNRCMREVSDCPQAKPREHGTGALTNPPQRGHGQRMQEIEYAVRRDDEQAVGLAVHRC